VVGEILRELLEAVLEDPALNERDQLLRALDQVRGAPRPWRGAPQERGEPMSAASGLVCLHLHYLPNVDDGVKSLEQGIALCRGLAELGYTQLVTTPHIRSEMFENRRPALEAAFAAFQEAAAGEALPTLGLGAEHHLDDIVWALLENGQGVPYPRRQRGAHRAARGARARRARSTASFACGCAACAWCWRTPSATGPSSTAPTQLDPLLDAGALPLLDLMSLTGRYGKAPQRAAERMLDEGHLLRGLHATPTSPRTCPKWRRASRACASWWAPPRPRNCFPRTHGTSWPARPSTTDPARVERLAY
jgi:protein-tyrosine phosphatase